MRAGRVYPDPDQHGRASKARDTSRSKSTLVGARPKHLRVTTLGSRAVKQGMERRKGKKTEKRANVVSVVCLVLAGQFENNRDTAHAVSVAGCESEK